MATNLLNRAQLSYSRNGETATVLSNQTSTTLADEYVIDITKTAVTDTVRPGGNASYVVRVENTGAGTLYNVSVTDNLGTQPGTMTAPLAYVADSAIFYINGAEVTGTDTATATDVKFTVTEPLAPGDNLVIVYAATLDDNQMDSVENTVTAFANSGSAAGALISDTATATITPESFASIAIVKAASATSVISGDELTYTFTMVNTGGEAVEAISLVDELPTEFNVTSVSYTVDGVTTPVASSDYSIAPPNTLTLPSISSSLQIPVAAATSAGPGVTIITVTGTVS